MCVRNILRHCKPSVFLNIKCKYISRNIYLKQSNITSAAFQTFKFNNIRKKDLQIRNRLEMHLLARSI